MRKLRLREVKTIQQARGGARAPRASQLSVLCAPPTTPTRSQSVTRRKFGATQVLTTWSALTVERDALNYSKQPGMPQVPPPDGSAAHWSTGSVMGGKKLGFNVRPSGKLFPYDLSCKSLQPFTMESRGSSDQLTGPRSHGRCVSVRIHTVSVWLQRCMVRSRG